jgi:hypothetical protein
MTSKDPAAGGTSPVMTSQGELELGPCEAPTRVVALEDNDV